MALPISLASNLSEYSRKRSMISWNEPRIGIDKSTCPLRHDETRHFGDQSLPLLEHDRKDAATARG